MRVVVVLGTRPEIIKMAPILEALYSEKMPAKVVHTGQHYQYQMDQIFFDELGLTGATHNLSVGSLSQAEQTGEMLKRIEPMLLKERPDVVLVQGDTNSVLAGALAAAKIHIPVGHVEAGLRSFDKRIPVHSPFMEPSKRYMVGLTTIGTRGLIIRPLERQWLTT